ncbi:hypothetical protein BH23PLA1_BH23PLA1_40610 [soil metagenome]
MPIESDKRFWTCDNCKTQFPIDASEGISNLDSKTFRYCSNCKKQYYMSSNKNSNKLEEERDRTAGRVDNRIEATTNPGLSKPQVSARDSNQPAVTRSMPLSPDTADKQIESLVKNMKVLVNKEEYKDALARWAVKNQQVDEVHEAILGMADIIKPYCSDRPKPREPGLTNDLESTKEDRDRRHRQN